MAAETAWLDEMDLSQAEQEYGTPRGNRSVEGNALSVGGKEFDRGFGTHANSKLRIDLKGAATRFTAQVGVDDEKRGSTRASIEFKLIGDGKTLWASGVMHADQDAKAVDVSLAGVKKLILYVSDADDGNYDDHADWGNAKFEYEGTRPAILSFPKEEPYILTPPVSSAPRINGARVVGCRPNHPFLFRIPATGERPMTFKVRGLPQGLAFDAQTGIISGSVLKPGESVVTLIARNHQGSAKRTLKIVCGQQIALTPPLGWNSWNCFASAVTTDKVKSAAKAMVESGLADHGWTYINIDDFWEKNEGSTDATLGGPGRNQDGKIVPNPRFPDMKGLADYVHGLGLKIGIYSSPGPTTCGGCLGSYDHEYLDAQSYAGWDIDYLKYDWCSYDPKFETRRTRSIDIGIWTNAWTAPEFQKREDVIKPYALMRAALDKADRDIVFSLCQYGMGNVSQWGDRVGGNCWRTTGDIVDTWSSMAGIGFAQTELARYVKPGNWNDPDMLVVGKVGWGPQLHPTRLSPSEQYTHITLWSLACSPLLIGCDMTQMDPFTLSLLTNDEVLEVNQDPLGNAAHRVVKNESTEVWAKKMADGSLAVGLFNRGDEEATVSVKWSDLGLSGSHKVRDLWSQRNLGKKADGYEVSIRRHGAVLIRVW
jgi:alpha-galactosidase